MYAPRSGFRHDPRTWIDRAATLRAAQVRTVLLRRPIDGDAQMLQTEIDGILATQTDAGSLGDNTAGRLIRLSRLGCPPDRPEVRQAVTAMCRDDLGEEGRLGPYEIQAAAWGLLEPLSDQHASLLAASVEALARQVMDLDFWCACPWTGEVHLQGLLSGRQYADVAPALDRGFQVMVDALGSGTGFPPYLDPWGFLDCAGRTDHALARQVVLRQVPFILRAQRDDGTWGGPGHLGFGPADHTFLVVRALLRHDLLEELRSLPPLPPDWDLGESLPLPPGDFRSLTWDGSHFWLLDAGAPVARRLTEKGGSTDRQIDLPEGANSIGWIGDALLAVRADPNVLYRICPFSGEVREETALDFWGDARGVAAVGNRLAIGNLHCGGVHLSDAEGQISPHPHMLAGSWVTDLTGAGDTIWHLDGFSPALVHSGLDQHHHLLEWGDQPFGESTAGVAHDGSSLWLLDNDTHRVCSIVGPSAN